MTRNNQPACQNTSASHQYDVHQGDQPRPHFSDGVPSVLRSQHQKHRLGQCLFCDDDFGCMARLQSYGLDWLRLMQENNDSFRYSLLLHGTFAREDRNNLANPSSLQATIDCKVIGLQTIQTSSGLHYEHEHSYSI